MRCPICNRLHQTDKVVEYMRARGVHVEPDITIPPPKLFPSSKKTPRLGWTIRREAEGNRPLIAEPMAWGVPCFVKGARPGTTLEKLATNARQYSYSVWKPLIADAAQRCLVPFTHFAEPHPEGGKGDDGLPKQAWFSLPDEPVGMFAGVWQGCERGRVFAFLTTAPNDQMRPIHPKAMPVILKPGDQETWLSGTGAEALSLARPYDGPMDMQVKTPPA
jgi:putative SOS response-associated peptidase YedK